ncbi:hypothetical protein ES703_34343 [subsurface metagenome]
MVKFKYLDFEALVLITSAPETGKGGRQWFACPSLFLGVLQKIFSPDP